MKRMLISLLLCCSALRAMDSNNNNNNNRYNPPLILEEPDQKPLVSCAPSAPLDGDDSDDEQEVQAAKHRVLFQHSLQALKERRAGMKKDHMMLHVAFKNKSGSEFLSKSMSYDINADGTCPPTDGWQVISFENTNGLSSNPLPLDYENPLHDDKIQATGLFNFAKVLIQKRAFSRVSEEQKEREKTTYTTCFAPLGISLDQKTVTLLVSLTKILDGQDSLVVPKTKCTVPLYMKYKQPYRQEFQPADTEPIALEITTGVYSNL